MEIETAARRHMLTLDTIRSLVVDRVYKFRLTTHVAGTGQSALVTRRSNGWSQPDDVQTSEFPVLVFDCWADPSRDAAGEMLQDDAIDRAYSLYRAVDKAVHGIRDVWWGAGGTNPGLRIVSAARWAEPFHFTKTEKFGSGPAEFGGVPLAECAVVVAQYAIHTVH